MWIAETIGIYIEEWTDFYITFIDLVYDGCNLIKMHNFIMGLISRDLLWKLIIAYPIWWLID